MKIYLSIIMLLILSPAIFAQKNSCDLQFEVYKYKADLSAKPIRIKTVNAVLRNTKTQKKPGAILKNEMPFFANLPVGEYEALVSFPGYKSTTKKIKLDCTIAGDQNLTTEVIFLWEGNPKEKTAMSSEIFTIGADPAAPNANSSLATVPGVHIATPAYPPAAHAVRAAGTVNVQVLIDELGRVVSAKALNGHPLLRQAAEKAAGDSHFSPTILQGMPVKISGVIAYNFVAQ